ncbi:uncharacterized protein DUF4102 [Nitrosospira sp. Nsp5]|uniref:Arm DNA-binding domain-containing protein n=1 Tax=Nitrosospira TaxID=35798 RepID=UPI000A41E35D|nr:MULTISPECIES: Arm DNA-binding domain-containing protein [Nitrosospira]PTR06824.1 uncharacterized protein DUF4102 [Nitrosospira sp. Nsp5]
MDCSDLTSYDNRTRCRTAKPKDKSYKLPDGKGLYLEIKPNGAKAWRYRFELREGEVTKESTFAIGDYAIAPIRETPEEAEAPTGGRRFTLAEAREERTKARSLVKHGINPAPIGNLSASSGNRKTPLHSRLWLRDGWP